MATTTTTTPSFDYCSDPPRPLVCPICRDVLDDPVTTPHCQHIYCRSCLARALDLTPSCPVDRSPLHSLDLCPPAPRAVRQLIDDLAIRCDAPECRTEMRREQWAHHLALVHPPTPPAPPDDDDDDDRTLDPARTREGDDKRAVSTKPAERCDLCSALVSPADLEAHPSVCPAAHVPCTYCTLSLPLASHPSHLLHVCPLVPLPCPHAPHGCAYTGPRAHLAEEHLASECAYEPLAGLLERMDARMRELEADNWALRSRVGRVEGELEDVRGIVDALRRALGEFAPPLARSGSGSGSGTGRRGARASSASLASSPTPTPRARSPPSPSPSPSPAPSLPAALTALTTASTAHASQLSHLSHLHAQYAQHVSDEVGALRAQLGGVRAQVAQWAMRVHERERERERDAWGWGAGGGGAWAGKGWGAAAATRWGGGQRTMGDEGDRAGDALEGMGIGTGTGGSASSDDDAAAAAAGGRSYPGAGAGAAGASFPPYPAFRGGRGGGPPLPPTPGLRVVPPGADLLLGGGGAAWDGVPLPPPGYGYLHAHAHPHPHLYGDPAVLGGLGGAAGSGPGRQRGVPVPIPMGGAGAVKL